jgi:hypothetical protein
MKKIILSQILILMCQLISAQLNLSTFQTGVTPTSSDWQCVSPTAVIYTQSTFYGHANWVQINNPTAGTTYTFKRDFWVCNSDGAFNINISKALGDNHIQVFLDGSVNAIINKNVTTGSQFNTTASYNKNHKLKCGKHTLKVTVKNRNAQAGFMIDCIISGINGGVLSNGKCDCCCEKLVDARANVTINCSPGSSSIVATGMSSVLGNGQGWVLKKVNCSTPAPCTWVAGPIIAQGTGSSFNFNGLQQGACYILTHYVNKCSGKWRPKECRVGKTICFTVSCPQLKSSNGNVVPQVIPLDDDEFQELSTGMEKELLKIKGN